MLNSMTFTREQAQSHHFAYVAGIADALRHLNSVWHGDVLDFSVASLRAVGEWFTNNLSSGLEADSTWLPVWWDSHLPPAGAAPGHTGPLTRGQLKLIDDVHAYEAQVLLRNIPGSRWIIYKGSKRDFRNGSTVLQLSSSLKGFPLDLVYGQAVDFVLQDKPPNALLFHEWTRDQVRIATDRSS